MLVAGAPAAGVTAVAERLRDRVPDCRVVEADELSLGETPLLVVWVVSATAPLTAAEAARTAARTARTDAVVAVVNKIDDHRAWRQVLAVNRTRFPDATWVAAAAAPRLGAANVDDVVAALAAHRADPTLVRRNAVRARQAERAQRAQQLGELRQLRVEVLSAARQRCVAVRAELLAEVSAMHHARDVERAVRDRCREVRADVDAQLDDGVAALTALRVPRTSPGESPPMLPPPSGRRLESQLMIVLGVGFGVGAALVVARLAAALTAGLGWASALGAGAGVALTVWVVRARRLLGYRTRWERWTGDAVAALRIELEDAVTRRLIAVEAAHRTGADDGFRGYRSVGGPPGPIETSSESFL